MRARKHAERLLRGADSPQATPCHVTLLVSRIDQLQQLKMSRWAEQAYGETIAAVPIQLPGRPAATDAQLEECKRIAAVGGPTVFEFLPEDGPSWDGEIAEGLIGYEELCEWADDCLRFPWRYDHVEITNPPADFPKPVRMTYEERSKRQAACMAARVEGQDRRDGAYWSPELGQSRFTLQPSDSIYFAIPHEKLLQLATHYRTTTAAKPPTPSPVQQAAPAGEVQES